MKNIEHRTSNAERRTSSRVRSHWMFAVRRSMFVVPSFILIFAVRVYRLTISPAQFFLFGASGCRFTPTCSQYALDAVREHGALAGTILSAKRICRCHPWGGCGHDPVPEKEFRKQNSEGRIISVH